MAQYRPAFPRAMLKARPGLTLAELSVVLSMSGLVLAIVVSLALRQGRLYADLGHRLSAQEQLRHAVSMLPVDLRAASAAAGDIISGEARDTSIELRATVGSAVVCRADGRTLVLVPSEFAGDLSSSVSPPQTGDSLWLLGDGASADWEPLAARAVATSTESCAFGIAPGIGEVRHVATVIDTGDSTAARYPPGTPLRITRRARYSMYRSSDGRWYLGFRDWNASSGRFNTIQPVSGPFERPASASGRVFRYFDAMGAEIPPGSVDTRRIALVRITIKTTGAALFGSAPLLAAVESSTIAVALRNRPP